MFITGLKHIFTVALLITISACGGGGTSDTSDTNSTMTVSQTQVDLTATMGGITDTQTIDISTTSGGYLLVEPGSTFIQTPGLTITGSNSATLEIASYMLDTSASGIYTGSVQVKLCSDDLCSGSILDTATINVSLSLTGSILSVGTLSFDQAIGAAAPASQSVTYDDEAGLSYSWTADAPIYNTTTADWLQLSATSGTSLPATIDFSVLSDGLAEGTYSAQVIISSSAGLNILTVTYNVAAPTLSFVESSLDISLDGNSTTNDLLTAINLSNSGDAVNWVLSSDVSWLTIPVTTGTITTASAVDVQIIQAELPTLGIGTHNATITATYQGQTAVNLTLPVNFNLSFPSVEQVAPHTTYTGVTGELIIRGKGFSGLVSPVVNIGSVTATSATVINDTELQVSYPAITAGMHSVTVDDILGLSISADNLVVVDPATYTYAAVASSILTSKPIYDPVRKAIYSADRVNDTLSAFRYDAGTTSWIETTAAITNIESVALSNDGQYLIVPSSETFVDVHRVDPDSLAILSSVSANVGYNTVVDLAVPVNTGEMVLSSSSFVLFDPSDDSYEAGTSRFTTAAGSGGLSSSLNGDKVFGAANQIAFYDFTDNTVVTTSITGGTFTVDATTSSDAKGDRIAVYYSNTTEDAVYDVGASGLTLLGTLGNTNESLAISHDGNFVYAFDYDVNAADQFQIKVYDLNSPDGTGGFNSTSYVLPDTFGGVNNVLMSVSGDGNTLFLASSSHLIVWPIP